MKALRKNEILIYVFSFLIPVFLVSVFFALEHIYPFGDESLLVWDMNRQYISFYSYLKTILGGRNDLLYSFSKTLGGDMPGLSAYYLHNPLLLILLLFPGGKTAVGIEAVFVLQLAISGLSCSVLLNKRYGCSPYSLIFSTAYAFCSFVFAYIANQQFFSVFMILPLVLFLFLEVVEKQRLKPAFTLALFLAVWMNYYQAYMVIIFLGIVYLGRLIVDIKAIRALKDVILCIGEAVMLDAFSLIPTVIALKGQKSTSGADFGFYRKFQLSSLPAALYSGALRNDLLPQIYCSLIVIICAITYFFLKEIRIREKASAVFVIALLSGSMCINTIDAVWHGFNNPQGIPWRYSYMLSLTLVVLGYRACLLVKKEITVFAAGALFAAGCVILAISQSPYIDRERLIINTAGIIVLSALLAIRPSIKKKGGKMVLALLIVISFADLIYDSCVVFAYLNDRVTEDEKTNISSFEKSYDEIGRAYEKVREADGGLFRTEKTFEYSMNDPMLFDMPGLSHSSSCERIDVRHFMDRMGFCDTGLYASYQGGSTAFADSILGVRYIISQWDELEKDYTHIDDTGKYHIFRNEAAAPLAFLTDPSVADIDAEAGNTFEFQNAAAKTVIDRDLFIKADSEKPFAENAAPDEDGIYRRTGEGDAFLVYDIDITEEYPLYMFFDAPFSGYSEVFVNDTSWGPYFSETHWNVLCAGTYGMGEKVRIRLRIPEEGLSVDEACFYYEDMDALRLWSDTIREKNRNSTEIQRLSGSHLKFDVSSSEGDLLFISVPYDRGWHIRLDGRETESERVMGILTGVRMTSGNHEIEMRYIPPGLIAGIAVSLAGIILMMITIKKDRSV